MFKSRKKPEQVSNTNTCLDRQKAEIHSCERGASGKDPLGERDAVASDDVRSVLSGTSRWSQVQLSRRTLPGALAGTLCLTRSKPSVQQRAAGGKSEQSHCL